MSKFWRLTLPALFLLLAGCDGTPTAPASDIVPANLTGADALAHLARTLETRQTLLRNDQLLRSEGELLGRIETYFESVDGGYALMASGMDGDDNLDIVVGNYMMSNLNHMTTWVTNDCCFSFRHHHSATTGGSTTSATKASTGTSSNAFTSFMAVSCAPEAEITLSGDHKVIVNWGFDKTVGSVGYGTCNMAPE